MTKSADKILVVRVGRVGDMVMLTPALQAIIDIFPSVEIHLLTSPDGKRALNQFNPAITRLFIYDRKKLTAKFQTINIRKQLEQQHYTSVYCFEHKPSYKRLVSTLSDNTFYIAENDQHEHFSKRCLNTVQTSTHQPLKNYWVHLPVSDEARELSKQLLAQHDIHESDIVIGMHPSFSGLRKSFFRSAKSRHIEHKKWPAEHFAQLANQLHQYAHNHDVKFKIIMDLLPDERTIGENIVKLSDNKITLMTPQPNFERYKATIQRMDLLITPDTGPMHIAAAVGTHLVALFADKSPEDCGPYVPSDQFIALRAEEFPDSATGLAAIPPDTVYKSCIELLITDTNKKVTKPQD